MQIDCGAVNINDVISNLMCTTAPMGGWKTSGMGARFGGAEGLRKYCRQEAVVAPRTNVGAGGNYYNNSHKALTRMNKLMTKLALIAPAPHREISAHASTRSRFVLSKFDYDNKDHGSSEADPSSWDAP